MTAVPSSHPHHQGAQRGLGDLPGAQGHEHMTEWARSRKELCRPEGEGAQWALYFDPDSRGLRRVEVSDGGRTVLTARLTSFAKDAVSDDDGDGEGMG